MTRRAQMIERLIRDYLQRDGGMIVDRDNFSGEVAVRPLCTTRKVSLTNLACLIDLELGDQR
jgi:hypothetical protein